jgi:hypothetical protein
VSKLLSKAAAAPFDTEDTAAFQRFTEEYSLIAAYNQSKSNLVFLSDNRFAYADILKLDSLPAYGFYAEKMKPAGQRLVQAGMLGANFSELSDLQNKFTGQTVVYSINYCVTSGYGHIKDMLTQNGAKAGLDLSKYVSAIADRKLITKTVTTVKILQDYINELSKETIVTPGGGGGGGGSSGSYFAPPSSEPSQEIPVLTGKPDESEKPVELIDTADAEWANGYVTALIREKIISQPSDGKFRPNDPVTREEFTKMVTLAAGLAIRDTDTPFTDVPASEWSAPYISAAYKAGIINGIDQSSFGGKNNIIRQDAAVIIMRAFSNKRAAERQLNERVQFTDEEEISHYAYDAVLNLCGLGILSGYSDGTFEPFELCTRAQAAKILFYAADFNERK